MSSRICVVGAGLTGAVIARELAHTEIVRRIIDAPEIELRLKCRYEDLTERFLHVVYSGQIDRYFGSRLGRLGYRTLDFERIDADDDYQGTAIMDYCEDGVPWTRIAEDKHLAPWEAVQFTRTVCSREYSRHCGKDDIAFYPLRLADDQALLASYAGLARTEPGVTFVGRRAPMRTSTWMSPSPGRSRRPGHHTLPSARRSACQFHSQPLHTAEEAIPRSSNRHA